MQTHQEIALEQFVQDCAAHGIDPYEARIQGIAMQRAAEGLRHFQRLPLPLTWSQRVFMGIDSKKS